MDLGAAAGDQSKRLAQRWADDASGNLYFGGAAQIRSAHACECLLLPARLGRPDPRKGTPCREAIRLDYIGSSGWK